MTEKNLGVAGDAMVRDLGIFLETQNKYLIPELNKRYGVMGVSMGFACIVADIKDKTMEALRVNRMTPDPILESMVVGRMKRNLPLMFELVDGAGTDSHPWLANVICKSSDEDVRALAAYTFSFEKFNTPAFNTLIIDRYKKTEGTSAQIAIAYALYQAGEKSYLKKHIDNNQFLTSKTSYEQLVQRMFGSNQQEKEDAVVTFLAFPQVMGITDRPGLIEMIAIDIASDGEAYKNDTRMYWNRKKYSE